MEYKSKQGRKVTCIQKYDEEEKIPAILLRKAGKMVEVNKGEGRKPSKKSAE